MYDKDGLKRGRGRAAPVNKLIDGIQGHDGHARTDGGQAWGNAGVEGLRAVVPADSVSV